MGADPTIYLAPGAAGHGHAVSQPALNPWSASHEPVGLALPQPGVQAVGL